MAFNHDNFIASQNYLDLDASLDWYIAAMTSKFPTLKGLAKTKPDAMKTLYQNDPVMQKIRAVAEKLDELKGLL